MPHVAPIMRKIQSSGVATARGGEWTAVQVTTLNRCTSPLLPVGGAAGLLEFIPLSADSVDLAVAATVRLLRLK
jgi:hypothetical protein